MRYLIAGFGKFGRIAFERIISNFPDCELVVIEPDINKTAAITGTCEVIGEDAAAFLVNGSNLKADDIVIPMVPFHLAATYVAASAGRKRVALPQGLEEQVPHPYRLDAWNLFCSRADFVCPDDCPEGDCCTVTGLPREPLYNALESLKAPGWKVWVQRSFQILPGVGGYPLADLRSLKHNVGAGLHIIATACKCHGVLTGIEVG